MLRTGVLPLTIGQLKANGCDVKLDGNKGFTLSSDISAVMAATKLDFSACYLSGAPRAVCSSAPPQTRIEMRIAREQDHCPK